MAYDLDGSNQSIKYTLDSTQTTLNTVTYGGWFYADAYTNYKEYLWLGSAADREMQMETDSGYGTPTGFVFVSKWSSTPGVWTINAPATGAWHHIAVTYDWGSTSNNPLIYLDGVSQSVTERLTPAGTKDNNSTSFSVGSKFESDGYFNGKFAEIFMCNRILTPAEISAIGADKYSPLFFPNGLVFYDTLNRRTGDIMKGTSATLNNSPAVYSHPPIIYPPKQIWIPSGALTAPTVTTTSATETGTTTADLVGNVSSDGGATITERGFVYSLSANPTTSDTKATVAGTTGSMSKSLTGLDPDTTYHVRAYAINAIGTSYGTDLSFTTDAEVTPTVPTVSSTSATATGQSTATLVGNVASDGNATITERGFVYSNNSNPTIANSKSIVSGTTGTMSASLVGLSSGTLYYVRAYATNSVGTSYGGELTFTTSATAKSVYKKIYIYKVYSNLGVLKKVWSSDVVSEPTFTTAINSTPGELKVTLAREFESFGEDDDVKLDNKVDCWVFDVDNPSGLLLYSGYISSYAPTMDKGRQTIQISVLPYATEATRFILKDSSDNTEIAYNSYDPSNIMKDVMNKLLSNGGHLKSTTSSIQTTSTTVSYTFNCNTIKEAFEKVLQLCPNGWWWSIDPDSTVNLKIKPTTVNHDLSIGEHIMYAESQKRTEGMVNRVYFTGGGDPALYYVFQRVGSIASYGLYAKKVVDQRVTSSNTALIMADKLLDEGEQPEVRTKLRIVDNNGKTSSHGYNIESIKVGDTIRIKNLQYGQQTPSYWDSAIWDQSVWDYSLASVSGAALLVVKTTYHPDYLEVETSSKFPEVAKRIEDINRNLENSQTANNPTSPSTI